MVVGLVWFPAPVSLIFLVVWFGLVVQRDLDLVWFGLILVWIGCRFGLVSRSYWFDFLMVWFGLV